MQERRRNKRTQLHSSIVMKRLDDSRMEEVGIDIIDVSKGGVGFSCKKELQIGAVYESYLTIWTKEVLHAFLQIVRIELKGDEYVYGATFIGMPEVDASRIQVYQTVNENEQP